VKGMGHCKGVGENSVHRVSCFRRNLSNREKCISGPIKRSTSSLKLTREPNCAKTWPHHMIKKARGGTTKLIETCFEFTKEKKLQRLKVVFITKAFLGVSKKSGFGERNHRRGGRLNSFRASGGKRRHGKNQKPEGKASSFPQKPVK